MKFMGLLFALLFVNFGTANATENKILSTDLKNDNKPILRIENGLHLGRVTDMDNMGSDYFISLGADNTARIWSKKNGDLIRVLRPPYTKANQFGSISTSDDIKRIAVSSGNSIYIYNYDGEQILKTLTFNEKIISANFVNHGKYVYILSEKEILLVDTIKFSIIDRLSISENYQCISKHDNKIAMSGGTKSVTLVSVDNGKLKIKSERNGIFDSASKLIRTGCPTFSSDGRFIAVPSTSFSLAIINAETLADVSVYHDPRSSLPEYFNSLFLKSTAWRKGKNSSEIYFGGRNDGEVIFMRVSDQGDLYEKTIYSVANSRLDSIKGVKAIYDSIGDSFLFAYGLDGIAKIHEKSGFLIPTSNAFSKRIIVRTDGLGFALRDQDDTRGRYSHLVTRSERKYEGVPTLEFSLEKNQLWLSKDFDASSYNGTCAFYNETNIVYGIRSTKIEGLYTRSPYILKERLGPDKKTTFEGFEKLKTSLLSVCITDDSDVFLGASNFLGRYNSNGEMIWSTEAGDNVVSIGYSINKKYVLALLRSGVVNWYNMSNGELLFSVFVDKKTETAITWLPNGVFDGSGNALNSVGWHINLQSGQTVFITPELFYDQFFRPDLVRARIRDIDISKTLQKINIQKVLQAPPPIVVINSASATVSTATHTVNYSVSDQGGGIGDIRIFQNGKLIKANQKPQGVVVQQPWIPISSDNQTASSSNRDFIMEDQELIQLANETDNNIDSGSLTFTVTPGEVNDITITAFNKSNTIQSLPKKVSFLSSLPPRAPNLYVLSIGVNNYNDSSIKKLINAVPDAKDFASLYAKKSKTLIKPNNINVTTLTDADATYQKIMEKLADISIKAQPSDYFVWFIASHGTIDRGGLFGVIPFDFKKAGMQNFISSYQIMEASKQIKALKQLLILDTCHSGGLDDLVSGFYDARITTLARNMGLFLYASAASTEKADDGDQGHGLFTFNLLQGLNNQADDENNDGMISMRELGNFAKTHTADAAKKRNHLQNPLIQSFGKDSAIYLKQH